MHLRQFDTGAVAALETFNVHWHLLAFKARGYTTAENHLVDAFQLSDGFLIVDREFLGYIYLHGGTPGLHGLEANFDVELLALFGLKDSTSGGGAPDMVGEFLLTIDVEFEMTGTLHVDDIFTSLLWGKGGLVFG